MRPIQYIIVYDCGKRRDHHYSVNRKGFVEKKLHIRKPVNILDRRIDPDGYNSSSIGIHVSRSQNADNAIQHETLVDLLVALRMDFPEAMILGLSEIGDYYIKVSEKMNQLRMELAEKP